jgi:DNA-binding MarR family transcriptional regulator
VTNFRQIARMREALRAFEAAAETTARAHRLTPQRYLLLLMVKGAPDGTERAQVGDVAARLRLAPHTVTGAVTRAEAAGLVRRERCTDDRRRTWISLTDEGERRLGAAVAALAPERARLASVVAALDERHV